MIYQVDRIVRDVRVSLDLNRSDEALSMEEDQETLTLDELIRSKILEAVERVHLAAPYHLLEQGHNLWDDQNGNDEDDAGAAVYWGDMESGWVLLPDDFMRLVVFEMSDWERPVYTAITTDDPLYKKQKSRVKALRGTAQRPVVAIGVRPEGKVLEFYSCKSEEAYVTRGVYIPYPSIDEYGGVDISERCYNDVVAMVAELTMAAMNGQTKTS